MTSKKILFGLLATVIVIGGLIWLTRPNTSGNTPTNSASTAPANLAATESLFDFGEISMAAGNVTHNFKIKNTSASAVEIKRLYTSCMCTNASLIKQGQKFGPFGMPDHGLVPQVNQTLNPGEESDIEVVFNPKAHGPAGVGPVDRVVYIEETTGQSLELGIKALVTP